MGAVALNTATAATLALAPAMQTSMSQLTTHRCHHFIKATHPTRPRTQHRQCTPCIATHTCSEEVSKARLDRIRGLEAVERLDEALYHDYETADQKKVGVGRT